MSTVVILVDSVDITSSVVFANCSFEQSMNAVPGSFSLTVRDPDRTLSFVTGVEISLSVDGVLMFGGYVTQVGLTSLAPAADTSDLDDYYLRAWNLRGTDYNIIFDKRVIRNTANYLSVINIPISTDGAMVKEVVDDYTDTSDFTTTGISSSATVPGSGNDPLQQGTKLRDIFAHYSFWGGTVWYIDGSKNFIYVPFEDVEKRWGFSDNPNHDAITVSPNEYQGATTGFRQVEATEDASFIVNDALIWGGSRFAGSGGGTVFAREEDATSQSTYGRWQTAETHFDENNYKTQGGVDVRAEVIVNGPPGADIYGQQKGLRYSQWQFTFTWFSDDVPSLSGTPDHLVPGDIVTINLSAFNVTKLLPLRSLRTSFPDAFENDGTHLVQFDGTFGLQLSDPFTLWRYLLSAQSRTIATTAANATVNDDSTETTYGADGQFIPTPAPDDVTTVFTIPFGYIAGSSMVFKNGGLQLPVTAYTESDPDAGEITFVTAPATGDTLYVTVKTLGS